MADPTFISRCPPLVQYSKSFQARAASELRKLPAGAAVPKLVTDYGKLRDACRAINARRAKRYK